MHYQDQDFQNEMVTQPNMDRRWLISSVNMKQYPYSCIGTIKVNDKNLGESRKQTGFLISSNLVLTTASLLYPSYAIEDLNFQPGILEDIQFTLESSKQQARYKVTSHRLPDSFINIFMNKSAKWRQNLRKVDFLLCKLDSHITLDRYIKISDGNKRTNAEYFVCGCLHDKDGLFQHKGAMSLKENGILSYKVDTSKGQEGSPIIANKVKDPYVIGMHVGDDLTASSPSNYGLFFDEQIVNLMLQFQKELNGRQFTIEKHQIEVKKMPPTLKTNALSPRNHINVKMNFLSPIKNDNQNRAKKLSTQINSRSKSRSNNNIKS